MHKAYPKIKINILIIFFLGECMKWFFYFYFPKNRLGQYFMILMISVTYYVAYLNVWHMLEPMWKSLFPMLYEPSTRWFLGHYMEIWRDLNLSSHRRSTGHWDRRCMTFVDSGNRRGAETLVLRKMHAFPSCQQLQMRTVMIIKIEGCCSWRKKAWIQSLQRLQISPSGGALEEKNRW